MSEKLLINDIKSNNSDVISNNEEKQIIEEMAKVLKDYTKKNNIMASHVILECYAEELYSKNYRKQSEGEWKMKVYPITSCSVCGVLRSVEYQQGWNFCPNCGAKMKGGAE